MKNKLLTKIFISFIVVILIIVFILIPFDKKKPLATNFFDMDSLITFNLEFDIQDFNEYNEGKRYYYHANMSYIDMNKNKITFPIRIKLHGQFRVDTTNCNMPQLKINFEKNGNQKKLFGKIDKLYLIMACQKNVDVYQNYVIQEYLIYKMYNILTTYSFKVRLAKINLINTADKDTIKTYAFFREHTEDLAKRLNGKIIETMPIDMSKINKPLCDKIVLFNYLIANDDWAIETMHNIKIISKADSSLYPIAYDFDFANIISTPYSSFDSAYFYTDIQDYFYSSKEVINFFKSDLIENQNNYIKVFENDSYLPDDIREENISFLKNSFDSLKNW